MLPSMDEIYNSAKAQEEREARPFKLIRQVPEVLGFAHTDKVCEVKMLHCGTTLDDFMKTQFYNKMGTYERNCCCFDMMRQLLRPLERMHKNSHTHGDLRPESICVRRREGLPPNFNAGFQFDAFKPYESEFEFSLVDIGLG